MLNVLKNISCGGMNIDALIPSLTSNLITVIKILVPILLIFFGMLDMAKAVIGNDEKAMKECQSRLIKRFIYAVLVFLIVTLVQVVFGFIANAGSDAGNDGGASKATSCIDCFINGAGTSTCPYKD